MIRILNVEPLGYSPTARDILSKIGEVVDGPVSRVKLISAVPDCDALIVRLGHNIDREVIDAGQRLKIIATATTGLDHVDVEHANQRGIEVASLRGEEEFLETIHATAEHTWALLLSLLRNIVGAACSVQDGHWDRDSFRGHELHGKRLGVVGLGRIGREVARYSLAFGMPVAAYDPYAARWLNEVRRCGSLMELAARADVLTIHVPLTKETIHLVDESVLSAMPPGSLLINTSRGAVVNEQALLCSLRTKRLAGAALDVLARERDIHGREQNPLIQHARKHGNLLITPHIAGATYESMKKTEVFIAEKIVAFFTPLPRVDTRQLTGGEL